MKITRLNFKLLAIVSMYVMPLFAMEQNETNKFRRALCKMNPLSLVERHNSLVSVIQYFDPTVYNNGEAELEKLKNKLFLVDEEINERTLEDNALEKRAREDQNKKVYE